jgi:hypothetical protein
LDIFLDEVEAGFGGDGRADGGDTEADFHRCGP